MQFWQFAAAVIISYSGLPAGFFLASLTREELPTARRYLPWLEKLVILAVAAFALDFFGIGIAARAVIYVLLLLFFIYSCSVKVLYAALGAVIFAVSRNNAAFLTAAALAFLFGLLSGSNSFKVNLKKKEIARGAVKLFLNNLFYPSVAIALFLAFSR